MPDNDLGVITPTAALSFFPLHTGRVNGALKGFYNKDHGFGGNMDSTMHSHRTKSGLFRIISPSTSVRLRQ